MAGHKSITGFDLRHVYNVARVEAQFSGFNGGHFNEITTRNYEKLRVGSSVCVCFHRVRKDTCM